MEDGNFVAQYHATHKEGLTVKVNPLYYDKGAGLASPYSSKDYLTMLAALQKAIYQGAYPWLDENAIGAICHFYHIWINDTEKLTLKDFETYVKPYLHLV